MVGEKKLKELLNTRELNNINVCSEETKNHLLLRKKRKAEYSHKYSDAIKLKISQGLKNGRWTPDEHKRFIEGIFSFGSKWKQTVKLIKTRTCEQARSHCQKFFYKLIKFADIPGLANHISLKNIFNFVKQIEEPNLQSFKEFLIKAYEEIEKNENADYCRDYLINFLKNVEKKERLANLLDSIPKHSKSKKKKKKQNSNKYFKKIVKSLSRKNKIRSDKNIHTFKCKKKINKI